MDGLQFNGLIGLLLISTLLCGAMAFICFRFGSIRGSRELALLMTSLTLWGAAAGLEAANVSLDAKVFWAVVSYLGSQTAPVMIFFFAVAYTRQEKTATRKLKYLLFLVPLVSMVLAATNPLHGWIWPEVRVVTSGSLGIVGVFEHGFWFWVMIGYGYTLLVLSFINVLAAVLNFPNLFSNRHILLLLMLLVPWIVHAVYIISPRSQSMFDMTPVTFIWTGILLTVGIFGLKILDLQPIAYRQILNYMQDGVLVLDAKYHILEASQSFKDMLGIDSIPAGKSIYRVMIDCKELTDFLSKNEETTKIICKHHMTVEVSRADLRDEDGKLIGIVLVLRNISDRQKAEDALRVSEERYRDMIDKQSEGIGIVDVQECFLFVNPAAERLFGVRPGELVGHCLAEFTTPEARVTLREQTENRRKGQSNTYLLPIMLPEGKERLLEVNASPQWDEKGEFVATFGIIRDVTERKRAEEAIVRREKSLVLLHDITRAALEASDMRGLLQTLADRMGELFGAEGCYITQWIEEEKLTIPMAAFGPMRDIYPKNPSRPNERTMTRSVLELGHALPVEDVYNTPYMDPAIAANYPAQALLALPLIAGGRKLGAALIAFNRNYSFTQEDMALGEQVAAQIALAILKTQLLQEAHEARNAAEEASTRLRSALDELDMLATIDHLTGVYNRYKFDELFRYQQNQYERYHHPLSLILFDIDHFKQINDTYGHPVGDVVLAELAGLVKQNLRDADSFIRWGGEEFIILSPGITSHQAELLAEKIRDLVQMHHFQVSDPITISLGVTELQMGDSMESIVRRADSALYSAKENGRNRVEVFQQG